MRNKVLFTASMLLSIFFIPAAFSQDVKVVKFKELDGILNAHNDTIYVINFWATWCKPCVHELPEFNTTHTHFKDQKVKVILVSLDFKKDLEKRLKPFVSERKILPTVYLLDETDYNAWIDKVDSGWGGSIPATLITDGKNRTFLEKELTFNELKSHIIKLIH